MGKQLKNLIDSLKDWLFIIGFAGGMMLIVLLIAGQPLGGCNSSGVRSDVDKILEAKRIVKQQLNFPDTADWHDLSTEVKGNKVRLTVTAENAFGVPSTETFEVNVD